MCCWFLFAVVGSCWQLCWLFVAVCFSCVCGCHELSLFRRHLCRTVQDFLQILSIFAGFKFQWPATLLSIFNVFSAFNFNLELFSVECNVSVNYQFRWYATQCLPLLLVACIAVVGGCIRCVQFIQSAVFHRLPWGATGNMNLTDMCVGVLIAGSYAMYFGTCFRCGACGFRCGASDISSFGSFGKICY